MLYGFPWNCLMHHMGKNDGGELMVMTDMYQARCLRGG